MRYKFYTTSEKAWDAMLAAVTGAKKSIFLEMYIFADNTEAHHFFDILKQKARGGVKVKLIVDAFGSNTLRAEDVSELRGAGVEIFLFSYWLRHTHKKILVVDEETAFLGGVNIHKLFRKWNDLQIRLSGSIVRGVIRSFAKSYRTCGGKDVSVLAHLRRRNFLHKTKIWFLEHQQLTRKNPLARHYREKLGSARKSIVMVTPYFAPHRWLIGALHQAVLRGVRVEVMLSRHTDYWMLDRINHLFVFKLYALGIKFYFHPEMNHAKALLLDRREGMVGSNNIDLFSFGYNVEAGAVFTDKEMVTELSKIIGEWKVASEVFTFSMYRPNWFDRLLLPLVGRIW
ncbi:MAG: phosphatidylserine/phosphatidylglycerophosphate/cardiolipin synthase family protein [Candidatus Niyogibacteria bacterium]|nr:phosphatidylserine/phosphatidylglycerophosphate/cardiolipin synthase family protein [Candidatus Niyogibacteria bacterium]